MSMIINFPGGKRVDATFGAFTVHTDQGVRAGGEGSAPEPFSYFLASMGTCAGIYVLRFCEMRGLPTQGLRLVQDTEFDEATHRLARVRLRIEVPAGFPEKYLPALQRAADQCAVKRAIFNPPDFEIRAEVAALEEQTVPSPAA
jgi:ribosomal protein S12 methylthiotransferase accessory factor